MADDQRGEKRARKVWRELRKSSRGSGLRMTDRSSESGGRPPRLETTDINLCHGPTPSQRRGSCSYALDRWSKQRMYLTTVRSMQTVCGLIHRRSVSPRSRNRWNSGAFKRRTSFRSRETESAGRCGTRSASHLPQGRTKEKPEVSQSQWMTTGGQTAPGRVLVALDGAVPTESTE